MNADQALDMWDDYRDGTLDDTQREAFEVYLRDHPEDADLFEVEGRWLDALGQGDATMLADATSFTRRVVDEWEAEQAAPAPLKFTDRRVWRFGAAAAVAAAVIAVVSIVSFSGLEDPEQVVVNDVDPLSVLTNDMHAQLVQMPQDPAEIILPRRYRISQDQLLGSIMSLGPHPQDLFGPRTEPPPDAVAHANVNRWVESMNVRYNPLSGEPLEASE